MKRAAFALLFTAALTVPPVAALEWKVRHLALKTAPLQKTAETTFEFTNTGDRTVTITGVDTSCDCLEATPSTRTVAPGASGTIKAHFNLSGATGTLQRMIIVGTDEPERTTALTVELEVPEIALLTPRSVEWKLGGETKEAVVDIQVVAGIELTIAGVQATSNAFAHRLEIVEPGRHFRLHLTPKDVTKPANAAFRLYAKTATGEELVFSAYANVR